MDIIGFISYVSIMAFTPGVNNIMSMSNARKYGFKKSLPFNFGILAGFLINMIVVALFLTLLYELIPTIKPYMLLLGASYIAYLSISMLFTSKHTDTKKRATNTFSAGMLLQFVNVKGYLYGLTTISTFIVPHFDSSIIILLFAILLAIIGFGSTVVWALFGAILDAFFKKHEQTIHRILACILLFYALRMLLDGLLLLF